MANKPIHNRITLNIGRICEKYGPGNLLQWNAVKAAISNQWYNPVLTMHEVQGKTGEPTFVVSFDVYDQDNFDKVWRLANHLGQDAIAIKYQHPSWPSSVSMAGMQGPKAGKYGKFNHDLFTTEKEAEMMSHPKAHAAYEAATALNTADRLTGLEKRVAELELRANAQAAVIRTGWMAGAGSAKPAPEPAPKPEPRPTDEVTVVMTRALAQACAVLLYSEVGGNIATSLPFTKALGWTGTIEDLGRAAQKEGVYVVRRALAGDIPCIYDKSGWERRRSYNKVGILFPEKRK